MVHAHYSELDAIYAFNSQPSQCLYYVIIRIIVAGVSLFKILLLILQHHLKGPMAEWHNPHEAIHVIVGSISEST